MVDRDLLEFDQLGQPGATLDDEVETASQRFQRLYLQVGALLSDCYYSYYYYYYYYYDYYFEVLLLRP